jgi:hypothetical protein
MNRRIVAPVLVILVLVAIALGVGAAAYSLGVAQGAAQVAQVAPGEAPRVVPYAYGWYGGPFFWRPFGWGFGFLWFCLTPLLFLGGLWLLSRLFFFRRRGWRGDWAERRQQAFDEWHRRAHDQGTGSPTP